ncbi:hypothetical protein PIROE2DRAFT_6014 [Piromyces sp. E2]|nr:hypothetical protein PIROE2DRAFT_6014 [Piromyces sp. E2]|eukprot:OUM66699.1 hypothetical protein PIROE2DRAFT_6014 [Piromyces sp. E2]
MASIYSLLYSYRDTKESKLPEFTSKNAVDALNKILEIKNELSTDDIFMTDEYYNSILLYNGNIIFSHFWDLDYHIPNYVISPLPGKYENVSGSCYGGYILGINNYITNEKKSASIDVLKFLTSEYIQKEIIIKKFETISGMHKLYDDKDVCSYVNCKLIKGLQGIERPSSLFENYNYYSTKITNLFSQFLYHGKSVQTVLREIDDITKIYDYTYTSSIEGLQTFLSLGLNFIYIPVSYRLIINFPIINKYSTIISDEINAKKMKESKILEKFQNFATPYPTSFIQNTTTISSINNSKIDNSENSIPKYNEFDKCSKYSKKNSTTNTSSIILKYHYAKKHFNKL